MLSTENHLRIHDAVCGPHTSNWVARLERAQLPGVPSQNIDQDCVLVSLFPYFVPGSNVKKSTHIACAISDGRRRASDRTIGLYIHDGDAANGSTNDTVLIPEAGWKVMLVPSGSVTCR
jgi:hypothetical protein